jgi:hypothetical protein
MQGPHEFSRGFVGDREETDEELGIRIKRSVDLATRAQEVVKEIWPWLDEIESKAIADILWRAYASR